MHWWIWMLLGLGLLAAELTMPSGLYVLFFGISAVLVGTLVGLGLGLTVWMQWLLFSVLAIGALLVLRKPLKARLTVGPKEPDVDSLVGQIAIVTEDVPVNGAGRVEFRGSPWTAKNAGDVPLTKGQRCRVVRAEGLTLWINPE